MGLKYSFMNTEKAALGLKYDIGVLEPKSQDAMRLLLTNVHPESAFYEWLMDIDKY